MLTKTSAMEKNTKLKQVFLDEVIRLYFEEGCSEEYIANLLSIGHTTVNRWVKEYAANKCKDKKTLRKEMSSRKNETIPPQDDARSSMLIKLKKKLAKARQEVTVLEEIIEFLQKQGEELTGQGYRITEDSCTIEQFNLS